MPTALTARQLVRYVADLHRVADRGAPDAALATVALLDVADRRVDGFSKGMRQRTKVAAALVTDPPVLVLDEPLNGADPVQRVQLIELFRQLGGQGRTVIVSSHVLNEVERLAERVIVLVHGRLAAAGGHRAIRDAMDDRPRRVLVRADGPAPGLGAGALDSVTGVTFDRARDGLVVPTTQAASSPSPCPGWPRRRRCACSRSAPSTTRWRASSASWSDDCAGDSHAAARRSRSSRYTLRSCFPPRRWAAVLAACAAAVLFGLLARAIDDDAGRAFANVAAEGIFGLVVPIAALVIGDAVLGAEVRAGTFHFTWLSPAPIWQIVIGRWLGGMFVAFVTIAPACALAAFVAGAPGAAGPAPWPRCGLRLLRRPVHRHRLHHPAHRGLVAGDRVPRRTTARRGADRHRPAVADVGVAGDLPRPAPRGPRRLVRDGIPAGGAAVFRLLVVTAGRWRSPPGACPACSSLARQGLKFFMSSGFEAELETGNVAIEGW